MPRVDAASYSDYLDEYLESPDAFQSAYFHGEEGLREEGGETRRGVLARIKQLAWLAWAQPSIRLQLLVIDNQDWGEVYLHCEAGWNWILAQPGVRVAFVQVSGASELPRLDAARRVTSEGRLSEAGTDPPILGWGEVDLILLDIFLGKASSLGSEMVPKYSECAPHAPVFLLSQLDARVLAAAGVSAKAERLINKDDVAGVLCEFKRVFDELFGSILWTTWCARGEAQSDDLVSMSALTGLLGSLRRWHHEPEILFHGYALPEMVDHAFRHTREVWRIANTILGPLLRREPDLLSGRERVALCLGIWLHDVGHVGDEQFDGASDIRRFHGSISERLALRNPAALAMDWLLRMCTPGCSEARHGDERTRFRNLTSSCERAAGSEPCPLRKAGLLARYHQQSAPLTAQGVERLRADGKPLTPYCRVQLAWKSSEDVIRLEEEPDGNKAAEAWLDVGRPLSWDAHLVRALEDWNDDRLRYVACLVRLLDALQLHRCRVGSPVRRHRLAYHLELRRERVRRKIVALERKVVQSAAPRTDAAAELEELSHLDDYYRLLGKQEKHHWLHQSVVNVELSWDAERRCHMVVFVLDPGTVESRVDGVSVGADEWARTVWSEFIRPEILSQDGCVESVARGGALSFLVRADRCGYGWRMEGSDRRTPLAADVPEAQELAPSADEVTTSESALPAPVETEDSLRLVCGGGPDDVLAFAVGRRAVDRLGVLVVSGDEQGARNVRLMDALVHPGGREATRIFPLSGGTSAHPAEAFSNVGRDALGEVPLRAEWLRGIRSNAITEREGTPFSDYGASTVVVGGLARLASQLLSPNGMLSGLHSDSALYVAIPAKLVPTDGAVGGGDLLGKVVMDGGDTVALSVVIRRLIDARATTRDRPDDDHTRRLCLVPWNGFALMPEEVRGAARSALADWAMAVLRDRIDPRAGGGRVDSLTRAVHRALAVWLAAQPLRDEWWIKGEVRASVGRNSFGVHRAHEGLIGSVWVFDAKRVLRAEVDRFYREILSSCDIEVRPSA